MPLEVGGDAEASFAEFALVGLFSGVSTKMSCQVSGTREHFAAVFAGVSLSVDRKEKRE